MEDSIILTDMGYITMSDCVNKTVKIWDGEKITDAKIKYVGKSKLYKFRLSNGITIRCSPEYEWHIGIAKNLKVGSVLADYDLPILDKREKHCLSFKNPYIHAYFCINGIYNMGKPYIAIKNGKDKIIKKLNIDIRSKNTEFIDISEMIDIDRYTVPINHSIKTKIEWLNGITDAIGIITTDNNTEYTINYKHIDDIFLHDIQMMLSTLGIRVNNNMNKLCLHHNDIIRLSRLGFAPYYFDIMSNKLIEQKNIITITDIMENYRVGDTYCFENQQKCIISGVLI